MPSIFKKLDVGSHPLLRFIFNAEEARVEKGKLSFPLKFEFLTPRITRQALMEVESFFRAVYAQFQGEAIVFLYFSPVDGGKWRFTAIPQKVSPTHLDWETPGAAPNGWYLAGSIHSHNVMSAFHSGTDNADELGWDGIHVTVGKILSPHAEYAASVVIDGQRFEVEISDLVEPAVDVAFPDAWMGQVSKYIPPVYPFQSHQFNRLGERSRYGSEE
jgi:hypothetical protein